MSAAFSLYEWTCLHYGKLACPIGVSSKLSKSWKPSASLALEAFGNDSSKGQLHRKCCCGHLDLRYLIYRPINEGLASQT